MVGKKWMMTRKHPEDIISAAKTMGEGKIRLFHDPIPDWVPAADYLDWARRGLRQDDLHGRDAAVCYTKRAVCRYIDALMVNNHLIRIRDEICAPYPSPIRITRERLSDTDR